MPTIRRFRNAIPPLYAVLVVIGFLIDKKVGSAVAVVGAMLIGLLWALMSGASGKPGGRATSRDVGATATATATAEWCVVR